MPKAAVMPGPRKAIEVRDFPDPVLEPGSILLETIASEVCGTDVHLHHGRLAGVPYPIIPGHVSVGRIAALRDVTVDPLGTPLAEGDVVTFYDVHGTSGTCWYCLVARQPNRCPARRVYGITFSADDGLVGGWAERIYLKPGVPTVKIPDGLTAEDVIGGGCGLFTVRDAARTAASVASGGGAGKPAAFRAGQAQPPFVLQRPMPTSRSEEDKIDLCRRADDAGRTVDPRVSNMRITYADNAKRFLVANSDGVFEEVDQYISRVALSALALDGGNRQSAGRRFGGAVEVEYYDTHSPESMGRETGEAAIRLLSAAPVPAGSMPVVVGPGWGGVLMMSILPCGRNTRRPVPMILSAFPDCWKRSLTGISF